ncbi:MAG: hypothetical protein L0Y56_06215 [Nitrospira sp.]|nr:hypothetical protein [Nitrospira sp.]
MGKFSEAIRQAFREGYSIEEIITLTEQIEDEVETSAVVEIDLTSIDNEVLLAALVCTNSCGVAAALSTTEEKADALLDGLYNKLLAVSAPSPPKRGNPP